MPTDQQLTASSVSPTGPSREPGGVPRATFAQPYDHAAHVTDRGHAALPSDDLYIGCSGWQYLHWRANFYPDDVPRRAWLEHYADRFNTVEVNNSFYRLPESAAFGGWKRRVPPGFVFAVKASRFLTHMKKLKDPDEPLRRFFTRATHLGPSLGPVLYQLPPHWTFDEERLERFLAALPRMYRHAIEFRDPSWYNGRALALLDRYHVALCLHDMEGSASGKVEIGPFTYVRLHGTARYSGSYSDEALAGWADYLLAQQRNRRVVFAYFNNDIGGHAPRDATRLREAMARR